MFDRHCAGCAAKDKHIEMLERQLEAGNVERGKLIDRLVALERPNALAVARAGERGARELHSTAFDAETGTQTMMVGGKELPIEIVNGAPHVRVAGALVPADQARFWIDELMTYTGGGELSPPPAQADPRSPLNG